MANINFKGKEIVRNHHLTIPYHELVPDVKKGLSKKPSLSDNLIIHGDNLLALKALLPTYAGKIKCIYIDPPYNTGNENWAYSDNVNSPMMRDWLGKMVDKDDLTRHDKWLCMMLPRLKLLRELLAGDGAIFISIDDNEQFHLRALLDEVFGEDNFVANFSWRRKKEVSNDAKGIAPKVEYVVSYANSKDTIINRLSLSDDYVKNTYSNPNNDSRGDWRPVSIKVSVGHQGGGYRYKIKTPSGKIHDSDWTLPEKTFNKLLNDNRIYFGKNNDALPQRIIFLAESRGQVQSNLLLDQGSNKDGKNEILEIFKKDIFETPKPTSLIKYLISLVSDESSIILDSFAGSGTTAHAVLKLNKEDGGNRKFILIEMEDYADKITAERVRRVIKGVKGARDENLEKGFGGSFSYFELGKPIDTERILKGKDLPTFAEMARYIFYTATREEFDEKKVNEKTGLIGESKEYEVYLLYKPDMEYLKSTALTLERAETLGKFTGKKRLVFAPAKYLDQEHLKHFNIDFAQLPFEIYQKQ